MPLKHAATFPSLLRISSASRRSSPSTSPRTHRSSSSSSLLSNAQLPSKKLYSQSSDVLAFLLFFLAFLYFLSLTALPSFLASGIPAKISSTPSTLPKARQHITSPSVLGDGQRSVAALLQNRRMALETPRNRILHKSRVASTRYQPSLLFQGRNSIDYNRNSHSGNLKNLDVMVAYKEETGNKVPLLQALNASYWNEYPIYENDTSAFPIPTDISVFGTITSATTLSDIPNRPKVLPEHCPQDSAVRLFIAITTRCCTPSARAKRDAIRTTWLKTIQNEYSDHITAIFILSQPSSAILDAADILKEEIAMHGDIAFVPGEESYRQLPAKTLHTLHYALSSPCHYTHIVKTDDDVFLRPQKMLDIIYKAERQYEFDIPSPITPHADGTYPKDLQFDGRKIATFRNMSSSFGNDDDDGDSAGSGATGEKDLFSTPWLNGMYIGKIDSNQTGIFPGWYPIRNSTSKWYLSEADLPAEDCSGPLGARWASGWGYLMSRDVAQKVWDAAVKNAMATGVERPVWWGRLPWEDVLVATLLQSYTTDENERVFASHHPGFKAAWDDCDEDTVLKHLDNDAPVLTAGLAAQEASGLWKTKTVVCSSGKFDSGDYEGWRAWRNTLPDNIKGGFM